MYFDSLRAVLEMNGHGSFVWSAYSISLIVIGLIIMAPQRRRRRLLAAIRSEQRRAAAATGRSPQSAGGVPGKEESLNAPGA